MKGTRKYIALAAGILSLLTAAYYAINNLNIPVLSNPAPLLQGSTRAAAGVLGVTLLAADLLLPVPSSVIMIAHGAIFGMVPGTILSVIGCTVLTIAGYMIGRLGGPLLESIMADCDRHRTRQILRRYGIVAVIITRPIPLLSETVAVMAGICGMRVGSVILSAVVGGLPASLAYAAVGAYAGGTDTGIALSCGIILTCLFLGFFAGRLGSRFIRLSSENDP